MVAWDFTMRREEKEGRRIPKESFIDQFFAAKETVNKLKEHFGKAVTVYLVEKDFKYQIIQFKANIDKIDSHIKFKYTKEKLEESLKNHVIS